ncbi:MAG: hypothetical protein Q8L15_18420 [Methylobacter sp.]|nr:hypothetical protein [Methylobacter sp.]
MTTFTLKSRKFGEQEFTVPMNGGYVRCNGKQICHGGGFMGSTVSCKPENLETVSRKWWAAFLKNEREFSPSI